MPAVKPGRDRDGLVLRDDAWLPAAAAAKFLGVGPRQLQKRESQGYIEKRFLPRQPNESVPRVVYARADLEALKAGKPNVHARAVPDVAVAEASPAQPVAVNGKSTALAVRHQPGLADLAFIFERAREYAKPAPRPWLTLDEAAEYSGLSRVWLLREALAGAGSIAIRDMGKHARGGRWRFNREDLGRAE